MNEIYKNEFFIPIKREQIFTKPTDNRIFASTRHISEESDKQLDLLGILEYSLNQNPADIINQCNIDISCSFCSDFFALDSKIRKDFIKLIFSSSTNFFSFIIQELENEQEYDLIRNGFKFYCFIIDWALENYLDSTKSGKLKITKKIRKKSNSKVSKSNAEFGNIIGSKSEDHQQINNKLNDELSLDEKLELKDTDFIQATNKLLTNLISVLRLDINVVFSGNQIEDELSNLLIKIGFDILDLSSKSKDRTKLGLKFKESLFDFLQLLSNNSSLNSSSSYLNLKIMSKIVKLLYDKEALVDNLSDFITV